MRKIIRKTMSAFFALVLLFALFACQSNNDNRESPENTNGEIVGESSINGDNNNGDAGNGAEVNVVNITELNEKKELARDIVMSLVNGDFESVAALFDADMDRAVGGVDGLRSGWDSLIGLTGEFISIINIEFEYIEPYEIYVVTSRHENSGTTAQIVFSEDGLLSGLRINLTANPEDTIEPNADGDGFTEIAGILGEGTEYPLNCILSIPDRGADKYPAVVLVHGSGSTDMNETAYGIAVFKDISDHLAQNGIAVLRYDKRTYAHSIRISIDYGDELTVWEETIDDAVLAKEYLAQFDMIDTDRVYVIGHSLGGMLAPRIVQEANYAGGIIMAGSLRSLLDIIYDQHIYFFEAADLTDDERSEMIAQMEEAHEMFFGISEIYIRDLDTHLIPELLTESGKPFLIIQGAKDFQVYADVDFALYKEIAQGHEQIEFRLYENLNHLFTVSTMETPTIEDYIPGSKVDPAPLEDIVQWILAR